MTAQEELDDMLPEGLKPATALLNRASQSEETGTSEVTEPDSSEPQTEASQMSTQATANVTPVILTPEQQEQIRSVAAETAAKIIASRDSEVQVARTIEKLSTEATAAKQEATAARAAVDQQKVAAADLQSKLDAANTELAEAKKNFKAKDEEAKAEKGKAEKAKAELDEANSKLAKASNEKAVAERRSAIKDAGIAEDHNFAKRALATKEDGSLKMAGEDFVETLKDLKVEIEKAAAAKPNTETQAGQQQAAATTTQTQAVASTTAVPAPPDLSGVAMQHRAMATMANGVPAPSQSGVKKYAGAI